MGVVEFRFCSTIKNPPSQNPGSSHSRIGTNDNNMKIRVWTVLWTTIRKARNNCQDVDKCGDEDHCHHFGIDHCQTGNHCQDREHCQNGNEHSYR